MSRKPLPSATPRVSIAMATYKGGRFIEAQLSSILAQTLPPAEIVITDDASPDDTVAMIEKFAKTSAIPIHLHRNTHNLGVIKNFEKAMGLCTSPYIALCDQDDVWLPEKLALSFSKMRDMEENYGSYTPLLIHTGYTPVDAALAPLFNLNLPALRHTQGFFGLLPLAWGITLRNTVTGCTALLNKPLVDIALPFPAHITMHDHWLALLAAQWGHIGTLEASTVLYRQHGGNVVGAGTPQQTLWHRIKRFPKGKAQRVYQFREALRRSPQKEL